MSDERLTRLMEATQYSNIAKVNGTYVITFDTHHRSFVKGMTPTNNGFRLSQEEFDDIPIAFFATLHDEERKLVSVHEYWTLAGKLHRTCDLPAYVCLNASGAFTRHWYTDGVCTRAKGPASEVGILAEDHNTKVAGGYTKHAYKSLVQTWMAPEIVPWFTTDTVAGRDALDGPYEVYMKDAVIYTNGAGKIASAGAECAIACEELIMTWEAPPTKRLYPKKLYAVGFAEHRPDAAFTGRVAGHLEVYWCDEYQHFSKNDCAHWLYLNMFQELNLFDGEFFKNPSDEFIALGEFDKIVGKK